MIRQRIEARQASLCVIGTGTTGLPLAALWAEQGFRVWGVDRAFAGNGSLADWCLSRHTEACLADMYEAQVRRGTLRPTDAIQPGADAYIVCVPTPVDPTTKRPALRCLETAIDELCRVLTADGGGPSERLLCIESTVPPGTSARIAQRVRKATPGLAIGIAYCAERAFPGRLLEEVIGNPRVIGAADGETAQQALALYAAFARAELHTTDLQTAEFTKLVENAYRDVNLAFANEVALLARRYDVSPTEAIELANHHPRVHILRPGCGVGGECIPVDPWFLLSPNETQAQLIPAARRVNDAVPARIAEEIMHHLPGGGVRPLAGLTVAALGLTYKPDAPDIRNSPAAEIVRLLEERGLRVRATDPVLSLCGGRSPVTLHTVDDAVEGAEALLLLVDHSCFASVPRRLAGRSPAGRRLVDATFSSDSSGWEAAGFEVVRLGGRGVGPASRPQTSE